MIHSNRIWRVQDIDSVFALAQRISMHNNQCCCAAFRIGNYYWLNDARSEDIVQVYAVVRQLDSHTFIQIESIVLSWCDEQRTVLFIEQTLAGEFDSKDMCRRVWPALESTQQHGRCQHCA